MMLNTSKTHPLHKWKPKSKREIYETYGRVKRVTWGLIFLTIGLIPGMPDFIFFPLAAKYKSLEAFKITIHERPNQ